MKFDKLLLATGAEPVRLPVPSADLPHVHTLRSLGDSERGVWLADSFEGLPKADVENYPIDAEADILSTYDFLAVSEDRVRAALERYGVLDDRVHFLKGWFSDTLPPLLGKHQWSLLRLDGDHYESTIVALESLYPDLAPGGFVVVDDYGAIAQCQLAVNDFRAAHGIEDELHTIDWTGVWWRRPGDPTPAAGGGRSPGSGRWWRRSSGSGG